ncbi:glutamate--tRNA ligase [Trichothermofontia sichuanensis B231]|uniref:glutamate--tRNA ligase n=1 Tax=Trichothermofontia sichuanensis TaxID=3045816 RepID=UPI0022450339|nr:glutamate--tRNA ligase [Trichothermofontia sichuanensis]UZQ53144.1 glutamate--tRNA ligase [Trichothermofontia sichuanensis B231]
MTVRVRIAPSPTGNLHIGTARTAVFNWLFARHHGGQFILRIEDTDQERSRPEFTQNILDGLTWLGLTWDEGPFFQSQRLALYEQAVRTLLDKGLAYYCYCTEDELEAMRSAQKARGEAPRYDNRHRHLTPAEQAAFVAQGRQPVVRFKIDDDRTISWTDLVRGTVTWQGSDLGGDMVIARRAPVGEIGQPLYNFVVVVDDIDMGMTHIIRGEDHIANTAKQILLYEALGAAVPQFGHTPLILNQAGQKLSKRDGVTSISDFRKMGYLPQALVNYMTLLGWSPPDSTQERFTLAEAAAVFGFDRVNRAGAKFDWDKLNWLNGQYLHDLPVPELTDLLIPYWQEAGYAFDPVADRAWLERLAALLGPSLSRLDEAVAMSQLFFSETVTLDGEAQAQLQQDGAAAVLTAILAAIETRGLDAETASGVLKEVTKSTGLKRGMVMRTLRAALTGAVHGPDLTQAWLLLHERGTDRPRLQAALAVAQPA